MRCLPCEPSGADQLNTSVLALIEGRIAGVMARNKEAVQLIPKLTESVMSYLHVSSSDKPTHKLVKRRAGTVPRQQPALAATKAKVSFRSSLSSRHFTFQVNHLSALSAADLACGMLGWFFCLYFPQLTQADANDHSAFLNLPNDEPNSLLFGADRRAAGGWPGVAGDFIAVAEQQPGLLYGVRTGRSEIQPNGNLQARQWLELRRPVLFVDGIKYNDAVNGAGDGHALW
jgi:hypothetical protein